MTAPSSTNEEGWMNVSLMVSAFVIGKIAAYGIRHTLHLGVGQFAVHRSVAAWRIAGSQMQASRYAGCSYRVPG